MFFAVDLTHTYYIDETLLVVQFFWHLKWLELARFKQIIHLPLHLHFHFHLHLRCLPAEQEVELSKSMILKLALIVATQFIMVY